MYMSCGCNSSLQSGGRRKKRYRHSRRKLRGGGFFGIGDSSDENQIKQPAEPGLTEKIMNYFINTTDNVRETVRDTVTNATDTANNITDATKQGLYNARANIDSRLPGLMNTYNKVSTSVKLGVDDVKTGVITGFEDTKNAFRGVVGQFNPKPISQAGGRKHKRSKSHRKTRKGGKKSKRRTRKH